MKTREEADVAEKEFLEVAKRELPKEGYAGIAALIAAGATAHDFIEYIYNAGHETPAESFMRQFKDHEDAKRGTEIRHGMRLPIED